MKKDIEQKLENFMESMKIDYGVDDYKYEPLPNKLYEDDLYSYPLSRMCIKNLISLYKEYYSE